MTMGKVVFNMTMSLDGFVAGPNDGSENPLGDGGERLFAWYGSGDTANEQAPFDTLRYSGCLFISLSVNLFSRFMD